MIRWGGGSFDSRLVNGGSLPSAIRENEPGKWRIDTSCCFRLFQVWLCHLSGGRKPSGGPAGGRLCTLPPVLVADFHFGFRSLLYTRCCSPTEWRPVDLYQASAVVDATLGRWSLSPGETLILFRFILIFFKYIFDLLEYIPAFKMLFSLLLVILQNGNVDSILPDFVCRCVLVIFHRRANLLTKSTF